jgi:hypothetical protein
LEKPMHVTSVHSYLPRRWAFPLAHNDNVAGTDFSAGPLAGSPGHGRLPPFTSVLVWSVLAIAGWALVAAAIRWL